MPPRQPGIHVYDSIHLNDLVPFIDWTPFFSSWQLTGKYPAILSDSIVGAEATKLLKDAQKMLGNIISENWIKAKAIVGIFPANQIGNDTIQVFNPDGSGLPL